MLTGMTRSAANVRPFVQPHENMTRRRQKAWITHIMDRASLTRTELAREAGLSPSTLAKFENDPTNAAQLEKATVRKIEQRFGIRLDDFERARSEARATAPREGLAGPEAEPFVGQPGGDRVSRAVALMIDGQPGVVSWQLLSNAVDGAGYLPGDVLIVDLNAGPRDGDVVCAQAYDRAGRASTVFRLYQKPFLTAAGSTSIRPMFVDDENVQIRGVVVASLRARRVGAA